MEGEEEEEEASIYANVEEEEEVDDEDRREKVVFRETQSGNNGEAKQKIRGRGWLNYNWCHFQ